VKLLNHYGIKKELISYHEHNQFSRNEELTARLLAGESFALCSDAGMPTISDPGTSLVRAAAEKGIPVTILPGACAAVSALSVSGFDTREFTFFGFLERKGTARRKQLERLAAAEGTAILYESPHHLAVTLSDLAKVLGDRQIALVRELTKVHEEVCRLPLTQAVERVNEIPPKGEYVLVIEAAAEEAPASGEEDILAHLRSLVAEGLTKKEAVKQTAADLNVKKSDVYRIAEEQL
jgi:16S rRNA (cytidine1402-2'-O)-methyltransferase